MKGTEKEWSEKKIYKYNIHFEPKNNHIALEK